MNGLSASGLADLAGVTEAEVARLVELGILVVRDGTGRSWRPMCRRSAWRWRAGRPGYRWRGSPRRSGRGSLSIRLPGGGAFRRWAVHSTRTYRQVSQETGVPLETLGAVLESVGVRPGSP